MSPTSHIQSSRGRVGRVVTGVVAMLVALAVLATGAVALWANSDRGRDGYVSTSSNRYETAARAITSPSFDVGKFTPDWLIRRVRVSATSTASAVPVFVGIARSRDVDAYLAGVSRSQVRAFDGSTPTYANLTGSRTPAPPATRHFWVATAEGRGTESVSWKLKSGSWDVVVMNADGSSNVDAAVKLGAKTPPLLVPGLALVALGIMIGAGGFALVYRGTRRGAPVAGSAYALAS